MTRDLARGATPLKYEPLASRCYNQVMGEKQKEVLRFLVTLEPGEDGYIIAECPAIPGCMSQGHTREEALENIKDAILACLEVRRQRGMPLTVETQEVEVAV